MSEPERGKVRLRLRAHRGHQGAEHGRVMPRAKRKAFVDHDGCKIGVQDGRAERVLETADDDRFIDERVDRTPQLAPFRAEPRPIVGRNAGDDQDFEIRAVRLFPPERRRQQIGNVSIAIIVQIPVASMLAEGPRRQRLHNPRRKPERRCRVSGRSGFLQRRHQVQTRIAVKFFRHREISQRRIVFRAVPALGPCLCGVDQITPVVGSPSGPAKELIDARPCGFGVLGHVSLPILARVMARRIVTSCPPAPLIQVNGRVLWMQTRAKAR